MHGNQNPTPLAAGDEITFPCIGRGTLNSLNGGRATVQITGVTLAPGAGPSAGAAQRKRPVPARERQDRP